MTIDEKTAEIVKILLQEEGNELEAHELVNLLLSKKISRNIMDDHAKGKTIGVKISDAIASFVGSWAFVVFFLLVLLSWVLINSLVYAQVLDPYPFSLLNLLLSSTAAVQAPIIMMSQKRQEERDRHRAQNDYHADLKTEIMTEAIFHKIELLLANQKEIMQELLANNEGTLSDIG